jgi:hypothetical protein
MIKEARMSIASLLFLLTLGADAPHIEALVTKLASPSQVERDEAAEQLRGVFEATPRKTWEPLLAELKPGLTKKELRAKLKPEQRESQGGIADGGSHMEEYRLDNSWQLRCWFHNEGNILRQVTLIERMRYVWVAPPPEFTGEWITYFVNGQVSHRVDYRSGQYQGRFTSYHPNGSPSVVQNYGPDGADGDDTGYHPSGKVMYRAYYSKGKAVGIWTWYNEHGDVTSTRMH